MAKPSPFRYEIRDIHQDVDTKVLSVLCAISDSFDAQHQPAMVISVPPEQIVRIAAAITVVLAKSGEPA